MKRKKELPNIPDKEVKKMLMSYLNIKMGIYIGKLIFMHVIAIKNLV